MKSILQKATRGLLLGSTGALLLALQSCKLDETPYSSINTSAFYQTQQDAEVALNGAYGPIADMFLGPSILLSSDFSADQSYPRAVVGRDTYALFTYDTDYSVVKSFSRGYEGPPGIWNSSYKGIENANWVIDRVPRTNMDPARRRAILGEAFFLRAFYHFLLTKNFGDVIIRTKPTLSQAEAINAKSPKADVYRQILEDLQVAADSLPSYAPSQQPGRASKEAALGLAAKAALYAEDYPLALQKSVEVIASGKYSLVGNVQDLYDLNKKDIARQEVMFYFEGSRDPNGLFSYAMGLAGPRNSAGGDYGNSTFGSWFIYPAFYNSFSPSDARRTLMDTTFIDRSGKRVPQREITPITPRGILIRKYRDPQSVGDRNACLVPILRLADVYLIAAEAEARVNGPTGTAYGYLNTVRRRAGLSDLPEGLTTEAFLDAVLQERSWELFAEGDRWYDLTRTGKFLTVIPNAVNDVYPVRNVQPRHRYFPIPLDEIRVNPKIQQNPDWQ